MHQHPRNPPRKAVGYDNEALNRKQTSEVFARHGKQARLPHHLLVKPGSGRGRSGIQDNRRAGGREVGRMNLQVNWSSRGWISTRSWPIAAAGSQTSTGCVQHHSRWPQSEFSQASGSNRSVDPRPGAAASTSTETWRPIAIAPVKGGGGRVEVKTTGGREEMEGNRFVVAFGPCGFVDSGDAEQEARFSRVRRVGPPCIGAGSSRQSLTHFIAPFTHSSPIFR